MADSEGFDEVDSGDHRTPMLGDSFGGSDFWQSVNRHHTSVVEGGELSEVKHDSSNSNSYSLQSNHAAIGGHQVTRSWNNPDSLVQNFAFKDQLKSLWEASVKSTELKCDNVGDSEVQSNKGQAVPEHTALTDCGTRPKQSASWPTGACGFSSASTGKYPNKVRLSGSEPKLYSSKSSHSANCLGKKSLQYSQPVHNIPDKNSDHDHDIYQSNYFDTGFTTRKEIGEKSPGLDSYEATYDHNLIVSDDLLQSGDIMSDSSSLVSYIQGTLSQLRTKNTPDCWGTCNKDNKIPQEKTLYKSPISHYECDSISVDNRQLNCNLQSHLATMTSVFEHDNNVTKEPESSSCKLMYSPSHSSNEDKPGGNGDIFKDASIEDRDPPNSARHRTDYIKQPLKKKKVPTATLR